MRRVIVTGSATLLLLSHAAWASPARVHLAQADPNAPANTPAPAGPNAAPSDTTPADATPPAPDAAPPGLPPAPGTAAPAPAAKAPPATTLPPQQYSGTQRSNPYTAPSAPVPSLGPLPYGGTQATVGVPNPVPVQPYGSTQRDSVGSVLGDTRVHGGIPSYSGTQSTIGAPQNLGNAGQPSGSQPTTGQPYGTQPYGVQTYGGAQGRNGTQLTGLPPGASSSYTGNAQGNGTVYSRAPLGSAAVTRDQTGVFGGVGSYDARGVYTGTAPQPLAYGQIYATPRGVTGGLIGTGVNATGPLRPFVPPSTGLGRPNSGYGLPNGSRPTYMDARGIQRVN